MLRHKAIYGIRALNEWNRRFAQHDIPAMRDLGDTKQDSGVDQGEFMEVRSFDKLLKIISFLSVMNKRLILLYRGQVNDAILQSSLSRNTWQPWSADLAAPASLEGAERTYYWETLATVEKLVLDVLEEYGMPRWRHMQYCAPARWAVVQHYGLWPTPLIDFTTSTRVAASFAFGIKKNSKEGYLYVVGAKRVRSDLMTLGNANTEEVNLQTLVIRLNSVCPPSALRPHLQEGVLVGNYPVPSTDSPYETEAHDASPLVIAKFKLIDDGGFWTEDFPKHRIEALLPAEENDPMLHRFREVVDWRRGATGRVLLRASG